VIAFGILPGGCVFAGGSYYTPRIVKRFPVAGTRSWVNALGTSIKNAIIMLLQHMNVE